jgi:hypothetical protein
MLSKSFALFEQLLKLGRLHRDPLGCAVVVAGAGQRGRLFDQVACVVLQDRDPVVEFRGLEIVLHVSS